MKSLIWFFSLLAAVAFAVTPKDLSERLTGVTSVAVLRTDRYWDGGSVGTTLETDQGELFELRALNPKLSPDQRTLLFSAPPKKEGIPILKGSELEKQLIRLLRTQPKKDTRGHDIAGNLLRILRDRNTAWMGSGWYTHNYLMESFSPFTVLIYEGAFRGEGKFGQDKMACSVTVKRMTSGYAVSGTTTVLSRNLPATVFSGVGYPGKDGSLYFTFTCLEYEGGKGRFFVKDGKMVLALSREETFVLEKL